MSSRAAVWVLTALLCQFAQARAPTAAHDWTFLRNDRFGFSLHYPADVFAAERTSEAGDGQVFVSRDGNARLLVGALPNSDRQSPAAYQERIARQLLCRLPVTYRRLSSSWFALSGEGNGKTFYEKVIFSCNGRLINSFAMIYPSDRVGAVRPRCRRHREVLPARHGDLPAMLAPRHRHPLGLSRSCEVLRSAGRQHRPLSGKGCHRRASAPRGSPHDTIRLFAAMPRS